MPSPISRRLKSLPARADIYRRDSGRFRSILQIRYGSTRYSEGIPARLVYAQAGCGSGRGFNPVLRPLDPGRNLLYPGVHSPVSLPGNRSPKMLTRDSPTRHFQLHPATIPQIYFSAQKIDTPTSHESVQRFMDGPRSSDFEQAAVRDLIFLK